MNSKARTSLKKKTSVKKNAFLKCDYSLNDLKVVVKLKLVFSEDIGRQGYAIGNRFQSILKKICQKIYYKKLITLKTILVLRRKYTMMLNNTKEES
jgi:hypothetical protein